MSLLIALTGVLRTAEGDPIPEGVKLYRALAPHYRMVIASDINGMATEHWLRTQFIIDYAEVLDTSYAYEGMDLRERQLEHLRSQGKVELMIDSDAERCAHAITVGVAAMYFGAPKYARVKRDIRSWSEIEETVKKQRERVATDYAESINASLFDEVD